MTADVGSNYAEGPGGYYLLTDHSGPYAIASDGTASLISGANAYKQLGYQQITDLSTDAVI